MGYCYHNKQKDNQVYTKMNNNKVLEVLEANKEQKKMKQDYESVKNQVMAASPPSRLQMESNVKTVDIKESNKTKKYIIN
jgi:hypothetical protein